MTIELTTTNNAIEFKNAKLRKYTNDIFKQGLNIKKAYARIAVTLSKIEESQCYQADGFESVHEYSEKVLGFKSSQSYALLKIGKQFIDEKTFETLLPHEEGNDFGMSQVQAMLPLKSFYWANELVTDGRITVDMTVKEIKDIVKDELNAGKETETSEETEAMETENSMVNPEDYTFDWCIEFAFDKDGNKVLICGDSIMKASEAIKAIKEWK